MTYKSIIITAIIVFLCSNSILARSDKSPADGVRIVRDSWGIPHIFAEDEEALFFGAGYAAAEDRFFQMALVRYSVQGRLSEIFGEKYLSRDKQMRILGIYSHAQNTVPHLSESTGEALEAYAEGVNAYITAHPEHLAGLFSRYGGIPEPWTAADCVAAWLRIAERFDRNWKSEVNRLRSFQEVEAGIGREAAIEQFERQRRVVDEAAVIVTEEEMARFPEVYERLKAITKKVEKPSLFKQTSAEWFSPKMSHNWVISGARSSTGLPILESDPQITVEAPSTWYEFHLSGGRFNVRGIGVPGAPAMIIGFNDHCAWGVTALGSDNADLFQEQMRPESRTEYKWKDGWETIEAYTEIIHVKNSESIELNVQKTRHGPIVNDLLTGVRSGEVFALRYLITDEYTSSLEGLLKMMSATDWSSFKQGMTLYRSPAVHLIYADIDNNIGYWTLARLPYREHNAGIPYRGWTGDEEWMGIIPFEDMPHMLNPVSGFISTANNAPIGSWYPYNIGGGIGDNARSLRLKELLGGNDTFSPEDFLTVHQDAVNPIVRDFVRFSIMAVAEENPEDANVKAAVSILEDWDYIFDTSYQIYAFVSTIGPTIKRSLRETPLINRYLGSDAGLVMLFRDVEAHYDSTGQLIADPDIRDWLISMLGKAYEKSGISDTQVRPVVLTHTMLYQNNLEGFGSLAPEYNLISPPLHCGVGSTIWSQLGNSYSQIVNLANPDSSLSVLPPGNSEVPDSPHFDDQISLWVDGSMHLAPLSKTTVESIMESQTILYPESINNNNSEITPASFELYANFPNPFNLRTIIPFELPVASNVELSVYNLLGQQIATLKQGWTEAGSYVVPWNGRDDIGRILGSGIYLYRLCIGDTFIKTRRMTLIK